MSTGPILLKEFDDLVADAIDGKFRGFNGTSTVRRAVTLTPKGPGNLPLRRLLVLGAIHGDETGGLSAIVSWLGRARGETPTKFAPNCEVTFAIGNPNAVEAGRRFVDRDLNRSFGRQLTSRETNEDRRAPQIESLIHASDFVLDLHQTVQPAESAFFVIRAHLASLAVLASWALDLPILAYPGDFSDDGSTAGSYAAVTGRASLTLESGQLGEHADQRELTFEIFQRVLATPSWRADQCTRSHLLQRLEDKRLFTWGQTVRRDDDLALVPGLRNFSSVQAGQVLARSGTREIVAEATAPVLFPKYGELARTSAELVRCLRPLTVSELDGWLK